MFQKFFKSPSNPKIESNKKPKIMLDIPHLVKIKPSLFFFFFQAKRPAKKRIKPCPRSPKIRLYISPMKPEGLMLPYCGTPYVKTYISNGLNSLQVLSLTGGE